MQKARKERTCLDGESGKGYTQCLRASVDAMITNYPDLGKKIAAEYWNGTLEPELVRALRTKEEQR